MHITPSARDTSIVTGGGSCHPTPPLGRSNRPGATGSPFELIYDREFSSMKIRGGEYGTYEVEVSLRGGVKNLVHAAREINARLQTLPNCPVEKGAEHRSYAICVGNAHDFPAGGLDIVWRFTPLISDSTHRPLTSRASLRGAARESQESLLNRLGLEPVPRDLVRLAGGMFRAFKGFPPAEGILGSEADEGDLFEGKEVRTKSGIASAYGFGDLDCVHEGWDTADAKIGIAGGAPVV